MINESAELVATSLSREFAGFTYLKGKGLWVCEADDRVLLLVGYQASRTRLIFYLNFGVYFGGITPVKSPPKISDWHLLARYERFQKISVSEYNQLFSLENEARESLERRCIDIAAFSKENIIPNLHIFGNYRQMREKLNAVGTQAFEPYWAQNVTKAEIAAHILKK